ncbi:hypothetical protein VTH06DRAFT_5967 [Thermothelomyces fergusii]
MATDVQDRDAASRKRSHDDFLIQDSCGAALGGSEDCEADRSLSDKENSVQGAAARGPLASPGARSSSSLSEPPSSPPIPSPAPPAPPTASAQPSSTPGETPARKSAGEPPRKKRLTAEEKAAREAERRKREEERERKRREKEEADRLKAQQKAARAADRAEKEQEKKQRAEERERKRREKEEEELRKERSQMKLTSMFRTTIAPKKETAASNSDQSQAGGAAVGKELSLYDQMFKPFFVKEHVRMASQLPELDEETREAKSRILDEYLLGERQHPVPTTFEPLGALQIPYKVRRGRVYPSVRKIMAEFEGLSSSSAAGGDLGKESQGAKHALEALKSVPLKVIQFREDVRPPYVGTVSGLPPGVKSLRKLARKPVSRVLPLDYDYDSEAEWQEEEGEDVDDLDDDEEEIDMDEDMDDFLDDSEDVGPSRMVFTGGMEPESIGPSWEDQNRTATEPELYKYRLEFVLQSLETDHSIDPFSTAYWETSKTKTAGNAPPPTGTGTGTGSTSGGTPASALSSSSSSSSSSAQDGGRGKPTAAPSAPSDAFQALSSAASAAGPAGSKKSQHPLPPDMQQKLKDLVRSMPTLSRIGVIELFAANNPGCPKGQIKTSFDALFEKSGKGFKLRGE